MANKFLWGEFPPSSKTVLLVVILLSFVLLLVFVWLWYDLELTKIKGKIEPLAALQTFVHTLNQKTT